MAHDEYVISRVGNGRRQRLGSLLFCAFCYVSFVGFRPFAARVSFDDLSGLAFGDMLRPYALLVLATLITLIIFVQVPQILKRIPLLIPLPILFTLVWSGVTLLWSPVPWVGGKRLIQTVVVVYTVFLTVEWLGYWRVLRLFALCLGFFVIISLVAGLIVPSAIHLPGENDVGLVGAWRGVFHHKNHAGSAAALCALVSFYFWRIEKRWIWLVVMALGAALLFLSKSKTSLFILPIVFMVGMYFDKLKASRACLSATLIIFATTVLMTSGLYVFLYFSEQIAAIFADPTSFTGRVQIWKSLAGIVQINPLIGIGYGSIYQIGGTPFCNTIASSLAVNAHGHNGYLDILASTGSIGLGLTVFSFIFRPIWQLYRSKFESRTFSMLFAILIFVVLHNFLETSLLDRYRIVFITHLIICASVSSKIKE